MNGILIVFETDGDGAWGQGNGIGQEHSGKGRGEIRLKMDDYRLDLIPGGIDHLKNCHICFQDLRYQNEDIVNQQEDTLAQPDIIAQLIAQKPAEKPVNETGQHDAVRGFLEGELSVEYDPYVKKYNIHVDSSSG